MANAQPTKLRVGDDVVVVSGAHKGSAGTILRFNGDRSRVFVEGVNVVRKHEKPVPALGRPGGVREKEASIHISNVASRPPRVRADSATSASTTARKSASARRPRKSSSPPGDDHRLRRMTR